MSSLSTPLIQARASHDDYSAPSRRTVCLSATLLGLFVGVLTQKNDYNAQFMTFLYRSITTNPVWASGLYAAVTTIELLVFLCLIRVAIVSHPKRLRDVDYRFGMGSIVGVSLAWVGVVPGAEWAIFGVTSVSLVMFHFLMKWIDVVEDRELKEEEKKVGYSEYRLLIV